MSKPFKLVQEHKRGEPHPSFERCDFILTEGKEFMGKTIRFGLKFKFKGDDRRFTNTTHFAWVTSSGGDLAESLWTGVEETNISKYDDFDYLHVRMNTSLENIDNTSLFIDSVADENTGYGYLTVANIFVTYVTGWGWISPADNTKICSGYGAEGIVGLRRDVIFDSPLYKVSPPEINKYVMDPRNTEELILG